MQRSKWETGTIGTVHQVVDSRYGVMELLGSGGMAEVYLAHDEVLDRDVALKVLSSRYANDEEFVERFRREAYSAAALSHPNIVSIFDRGESEEGTYYIAMEYLSGGTLKDCIVRRGCFPPHTAVAVTAQIAEALDAAHQYGVVHRDVKPHNILVTEFGDVKVTDFGIARAASSSKMTHTGTILGTAHYVSPEQAMGEPVGPQSDLYSLGVVLYEMLTGEPPYDADSPLGVAMKHVNGHMRPPQEVNPSIPAGINAVTVRLLAKDPEDRYPDVASLLKDLERVEKGLAPATATTQRLSQPTSQARGNGRHARRASATTATSPTSYREAPHGGQWRRKILPWAVAASLLVALVLTGTIGWGLGQNFQQRNDVPVLDVPSLVGMTLEEAKSEVGDDFNLSSQEQESDEPAGTILDQNPKAGEQAEKGTAIGLVVSSGKESVTMPDVRGQALEEASQTLQDAGLTVSREYKTAKSTEPKGTVIDTDPSAGSKVEAGTSVTLTASSGTPEQTTAPSNVQQLDLPLTPSPDPASSATLEQPAQEQPAQEEPAVERSAGESEPVQQVIQERVQEPVQQKVQKEVQTEGQKGAEPARQGKKD
jgi:eukaryotic-like serine/threonine-protein kinase